MGRVLPAGEFEPWLAGFLDCALPEPPNLDDPEDPVGGHLVGLFFHRAWTMRGIAQRLEAGDPMAPKLLMNAKLHEDRGMSLIFESGYQGTHWLATFALYCLSGAVPASPEGCAAAG